MAVDTQHGPNYRANLPTQLPPWTPEEERVLDGCRSMLCGIVAGHPRGEEVAKAVYSYPIVPFNDRKAGTPEEAASAVWSPYEKVFKIAPQLLQRPLTLICVLVHEGWHSAKSHGFETLLYERCCGEIETHDGSAIIIGECFTTSKLQEISPDMDVALLEKFCKYQRACQELGSITYKIARDVFGDIANVCSHQFDMRFHDFPTPLAQKVQIPHGLEMQIAEIVPLCQDRMLRVMSLKDKDYEMFFEETGELVRAVSTLPFFDPARKAKWAVLSQELFSKWLEVGDLHDQLYGPAA